MLKSNCILIFSVILRNELALHHMGTIFLFKRASGASEAFSLVMKTHNCLRLLVLARNKCLHVAYMSSTGVCVLNWRTCPHLANVFSPRIDMHVLGMCIKKHAPTIPCSSPLTALTVTVVWTVVTMPCLSKVFQ